MQRDWTDRLLLPLATLTVNAAITYGVVSTQLQWIRADLDRQQRQIERIESSLDRVRQGHHRPSPDDHAPGAL